MLVAISVLSLRLPLSDQDGDWCCLFDSLVIINYLLGSIPETLSVTLLGFWGFGVLGFWGFVFFGVSSW